MTDEEQQEEEDPAVKFVLEIPVWAVIAEIQAIKVAVSNLRSVGVLNSLYRSATP